MRKFAVFAVAMIASWLVGWHVSPTWTVEEISIDAHTDEAGAPYYLFEGDPAYFYAAPVDRSALDPERVRASGEAPPVKEEFVSAQEARDGQTQTVYCQRIAKAHWGFRSLLPPLVAVLLCWMTREPVSSLPGGIASGALILSRYDLTGEVLIPSLATTSSAALLVLYLWLPGGLMVIWRRAGFRGVHHRAVRPRPAHRQARRLVPGRHLLPGRHGQHGARRHHGSPISDTTVLSSVCTGCDLMDHVKTQIPQASVAAGLAVICWTVVAYFTG